MSRRIAIIFGGAALAALMAMPTQAQVPPPPPLPHLEIHVATEAPPRPRHEHRPPRPGEGYVWLGGNWHWEGSQWVWLGGRWERPEVEGSHWVHPRYVHEYGHYRYEPGHWSNQRLSDGDDYRQWREEHRHGDRDHDRDRDQHRP